LNTKPPYVGLHYIINLTILCSVDYENTTKIKKVKNNKGFGKKFEKVYELTNIKGLRGKQL